MKWDARLKKQLGWITSLLAGGVLLGWLGGFFAGFNLMGISATVILGIYKLYDAYMVYKNEY